MKYIVNKQKKISKRNNRLLKVLVIDGYSLPSRNHKFSISGQTIFNVIIVNKKLAHPFVKKVVFKKYQKLLVNLTNLFVSDDEEGSSMNEVLNEIAKFKDEIKRKYRKFLLKEDMEEMSIKLKFFQKEAQAKQMESYFNENSRNRTR